jgi:hypothetical protein
MHSILDNAKPDTENIGDLILAAITCTCLCGWCWFTLRPTASRPVRPGIGLPSGAHDQILTLPFSSDNYFVVLP